MVKENCDDHPYHVGFWKSSGYKSNNKSKKVSSLVDDHHIFVLYNVLFFSSRDPNISSRSTFGLYNWIDTKLEQRGGMWMIALNFKILKCVKNNGKSSPIDLLHRVYFLLFPMKYKHILCCYTIIVFDFFINKNHFWIIITRCNKIRY